MSRSNDKSRQFNGGMCKTYIPSPTSSHSSPEYHPYYSEYEMNASFGDGDYRGVTSIDQLPNDMDWNTLLNNISDASSQTSPPSSTPFRGYSNNNDRNRKRGLGSRGRIPPSSSSSSPRGYSQSGRGVGGSGSGHGRRLTIEEEELDYGQDDDEESMTMIDPVTGLTVSETLAQVEEKRKTNTEAARKSRAKKAAELSKLENDSSRLRDEDERMSRQIREQEERAEWLRDNLRRL